VKYRGQYIGIAVNVSTATLAAALAAQPLDTDTQTLIGVSVFSDVTTTSLPNIVTRTIEWQDSTPGVIPPGDPTRDTLQGFYKSTWSQALGTPIFATPITELP
jgi:hypothetical protein